MIWPVVKRGDARLEAPSKEVTDIADAQDLITDLKDTLAAVQKLHNFTRGSGIAAPQIGEMRRVAAVDFNGKRCILINPTIVAHSEEKVLVSEGCLSFFDYRGRTLRFADVTVKALDEEGNSFTLNTGGDINFAALIQHELDHLDGRLYTSAMPPGEELIYHSDMPVIP